MSLERKFPTIWRLLPELFPETPADTRRPDHNLWQHLDTTAAIAWATKGQEALKVTIQSQDRTNAQIASLAESIGHYVDAANERTRRLEY